MPRPALGTTIASNGRTTIDELTQSVCVAKGLRALGAPFPDHDRPDSTMADVESMSIGSTVVPRNFLGSVGTCTRLLPPCLAAHRCLSRKRLPRALRGRVSVAAAGAARNTVSRWATSDSVNEAVGQRTPGAACPERPRP